MRIRVLIGVASALLAINTWAHTHLEMSMPANNAVLTTAPKELMLHFSEPTRVTALTVQKGDSKEAQAISVLPKEAAAMVTVPLDVKEPGSYKVNWRALGKDNHVMKGEVHFTIKAP